MDKQITQEVWERYLNNKCSKEEAELVIKFLLSDDNEAIQKEYFKKQLEAEYDIDNSFKSTLKHSWRNIQSTIPKSKAPKVKALLSYWFTIAAVFIGLLFLAKHFFLKTEKPYAVAIVKKNTINDIQPATNSAILKLADGSVILLDSVARGNLAQQGNTKVIKLDSNQLVYNNSIANAGVGLYNTLITPVGGRYKIVLPDGSRVWLNAASSLKFPVSFTGNNRKVELDGEAYFEVVKDALKPFQVIVGKMDVKVLGTHFNVNGYNNEPSAKTTLLEGSVRITTVKEVRLLKPGQQSVMNGSGGLVVLNDVDTDQAIAWKQNNFQFKMADIESIMRQLERWYDIQVVYKGHKPTGHYVGTVSRQNNLSVILKMLEQSGLHFKIDGRKVTVLE